MNQREIKLEKELQRLVVDFTMLNKEFGIKVIKLDTESRGKVMAACIASLQFLLNVIPEEWEEQWGLIRVLQKDLEKLK